MKHRNIESFDSLEDIIKHLGNPNKVGLSNTWIAKNYSVKELIKNLRNITGYDKVPDNILSIRIENSSLKYFLDDNEVKFPDLKKSRYCLTFKNRNDILNLINERYENKLISLVVKNTITKNIKEIYKFSFMYDWQSG